MQSGSYVLMAPMIGVIGAGLLVAGVAVSVN